MNRSLHVLIYSAALVLLGACHSDPAAVTAAGRVDARRLAAALTEPDQWFTGGRDGGDRYYSPLHDIDAASVNRLGLAFNVPLGTHRGVEATPLMVDGVLYFSTAFGHVHAVDARTGQVRWHYDPEVDGQYGRYACCDAINRGVAVRDGRVYVASLDGYLHAIDAATGRRIFKVDTLPFRDRAHPYTITGAPVVGGSAVYIGAAGADFDGARGYVSAWDARTGAARWRFYTVPRDPRAGPQDGSHLDAALTSWDKRHDWAVGGGGTVWDGISYDATLDLLYVGTGNAAPYDRHKDGQASGDSLYAASILAIHAGDGTLAWHYQTTPGDEWDYDSTQKFILTDLAVQGQSRPVLMQASKNGFLYVLDRATGDVISAHNYVYVNWTLGMDPVTHRPLPNERAARYADHPRLIAPGMAGGHNWQPMAYSPSTGLVYIPALEAPMVYIETHRHGLIDGAFDVLGVFPEDYDPSELAKLVGPLPSIGTLAANDRAVRRSMGVLRAVEPLSGRIVWEQPTASSWDGGVLVTEGNLVFQGDASGHLNIYTADRGQHIATYDIGTSILAAPMTYKIDGVQYVAVLAGYGGATGIAAPFAPQTAAAHYDNEGRLVVLKIGGGPLLKPAPVIVPPMPDPPPSTADARTIARGGDLYLRYCARCHVMGVGMLPDLRRLTAEQHRLLPDIVLRGVLKNRGMGQFDDVLNAADVAALSAYFIDEAKKAKTAETRATPALAH